LGYPALINCAVGLTTSKTPSIDLLDKYSSIIYHHQLLAADIKKKHTPLYGLTFTSFTDDVGVVDMKTRTGTINAGHMNAYLIIPGIVYHLSTKLQRGVKYDHLGQDKELKHIEFLTQFGYTTRKITNSAAAYHTYTLLL
jgi:hypothetical protein